jgi:hypothetical protein
LPDTYIRTCAGACAVVASVVEVATTEPVGEKQGIVDWTAAAELAREIAGKLFPGILPKGVWRRLVAIAVLAGQMYGHEWLLTSLEITLEEKRRDKITKNPVTHLIGVLRNKCEGMQLVHDVPKEGWPQWFSKMTWRFEVLSQSRCPVPSDLISRSSRHATTSPPPDPPVRAAPKAQTEIDVAALKRKTREDLQRAWHRKDIGLRGPEKPATD